MRRVGSAELHPIRTCPRSYAATEREFAGPATMIERVDAPLPEFSTEAELVSAGCVGENVGQVPGHVVTARLVA